jgi:N-acetyl-gamma-glutamyl-phosphate reductase
MEDVLSRFSGREISIGFMSHTLSINRGILTTIYSRLRKNAAPEYISGVFDKYYGGEPFIRLYPSGAYPEIKDVRSSNLCGIGFRLKQDRLITVTALDNLVKGASGQAVQNMNIMFGFNETESGIYP